MHIIQRIVEWLTVKWQPRNDGSILHDYHATFTTEHGRRTLHDLLDTVYCTVYDGSDPLELAAHNGGRTVVQRILEYIDRVDNPAKYPTSEPESTEGTDNGNQ